MQWFRNSNSASLWRTFGIHPGWFVLLHTCSVCPIAPRSRSGVVPSCLSKLQPAHPSQAVQYAKCEVIAQVSTSFITAEARQRLNLFIGFCKRLWGRTSQALDPFEMSPGPRNHCGCHPFRKSAHYPTTMLQVSSQTVRPSANANYQGHLVRTGCVWACYCVTLHQARHIYPCHLKWWGHHSFE